MGELTMRQLTRLAAVLWLAPLVWGQYPGQYPGGGYPPGGYPPGGYPPGGYPPNTYPSTYPGPMGMPVPIGGIHLPKRKHKDDNKTKVTVESVEGTLRRLAEKDLLLQTSPDRILRFRLIARTEFRGKDGKPMRDSLLHPGDRLTIDANPDDPETALHVILEKAGTGSEREAAAVPVDQARVSPPDSTDFGRTHSVTETESRSEPGETASPASSSSDDERPTLHRKPEADTEPAPAVKPADAPEPRKAPLRRDDSMQSVIADARDEARTFSSGLPDFLVQQVTTRYQGSRFIDSWRAIDVVTADVASVNGKEEYKNIRVNGRPTDKPEASGSWSTGEFQVTLDDVLSPYTAAVFKPRGEDRLSNRPAFVYDLSVDQPHSHWTLMSQSGARYNPAYKGTIWIDKETRRVLRIEQSALSLPRDFEYDKAESTVEYGFVNIDGQRYLLPSQSVNEGCMAGNLSCSRNVIDFRNYRKFTADSNITFDR
ncbi:MAG TPA: hypothetical protein VHB50_15705 [Bryobacteraceae bacterium]|nr:hypothetical protein [Bryobacteraceae bacterium]